jgi:hypothetical protein
MNLNDQPHNFQANFQEDQSDELPNTDAFNQIRINQHRKLLEKGNWVKNQRVASIQDQAYRLV